MNKNIFLLATVFLVSLNMFLYMHFHNFFILGIAVLVSTLYILNNATRLYLQDKNNFKDDTTHLIDNKADLLIVLIGLLFFILSRFISDYEIELLIAGSFFALIKLVRGIRSKKSAFLISRKNDKN